MNFDYRKLEGSLKSGFIDTAHSASIEYLPQILYNDKSAGKKVLSTLIQSLSVCNEFWFSVAFLSTSGVATLIETLRDLNERNVKGKILVSQYLNFTHPEALKRLLQFSNIELKIAVQDDFHSKGYLFKRPGYYDLIIGSSNLTASALSTNIEWNLKVSATPESYIIINSIKEFEKEFGKAEVVDSKFIEEYNEIYHKQRRINSLLNRQNIDPFLKEIVPNLMQKEALESIEVLRNQGKKRALLISATGTGKTFLSAFDVKRFNPARVLFVVHRLNIAKAAMKSYLKIFGRTKTMGVFSGDQKDLKSDFVFSTIQTISKLENLNLFNPEDFDYIIVDESHRAGAESYKRLLDYFSPKFLLGMTATPERTDGSDIFQLFDYNIAYEIRLHRALEEQILSPFHYYGVSDISVNGELLSDSSDFRLLTANERIERIIEKANFYGCDNGKVKGLIFCSNVDESRLLSNEFNVKGFKTVSLTGESSEDTRVKAIVELESGQLDYIFTVDIFNEGVDIPCINQIIMLRPTQSAIIFVQQLGRGLRKLDGKDYLTVIDFIGNYKNNYLVPIALYGDNSYNKDTLRKLIASESSLIPGSSTINFDKISRDRIFEAIDVANMQLKRDLESDYRLLKFKIGRIPLMVDFLDHGSRDPFLYARYSKSYFNFLVNIKEVMVSELGVNEILLLELFTLEINNAKRVEDCIILESLVLNGFILKDKLKELVFSKYKFIVSEETIRSCIINLNFKFIKKEKLIAIDLEDRIEIDKDLKQALMNKTFRDYLLDSVNCSIRVYDDLFSKSTYCNGFLLYNRYSRKDVCRILNWPTDISSTVYGYRTINKVTPCFVTYHKSDDVSETTNYNDHFIDQDNFAWVSRSRRTLKSQEILNVIQSKRVILFIKKEDSEGVEFYFMGDVSILMDSIKQSSMAKSNMSVVHFTFKMRVSVEGYMYNYITNKSLREEVDLLKMNSRKESKVLPFKYISEDKAVPYKNCIPLFDVSAAAGRFEENKMEDNFEWVELNKPFKYGKDFFVCKVVGESMNKVIPNGSWCLFRKDPGGSRNGKIVLVRQKNVQDTEFGNGLTVKYYESKKFQNSDSWQQVEIILHPSSFNDEFSEMRFVGDDLIDFKVIGVFVEILS
jgi:superfamily II DNA or RNA helicase